MEEWRALAGRVPATLLPIANGTRTADFLLLVNAAHDQLSVAISIGRVGGTTEELAAIHMPPPEAPIIPELIEAARSVLNCVISEHAMAGLVFRLCATRFGVIQGQGNPLWQDWEAQHFHAGRHAHDALLRLRHAAALCQAAVNIDGLIMSYPLGSLGNWAWSAATESLLLCAALAITEATASVRVDMAGAVELENQHVRSILG